MEPFPASPEPEYRPESKGPAPTSVQNAVKLIWVGVALNLLSTVITFALIDDLVDDALAASGGSAALDEDGARAAVIAGLVFGLVVSVALTALFAYFIGKGANWARIIYTVLGVIGILFSLLSLGGQPAVLLLLALVGLALTIAVLVLLYRPESNAYFRKA